MNQIYNSDKPIIEKEQDQFNRYRFSNRIAETIINRNNNDGLVIGLYGIWGEGKSSVLNMIENDLRKVDDILIVKFNPWRFKDEDALILNFLNNLSKTLDIELSTKKEKIGEFLKKYGSVTSVFNLDLSKIGETFSDTQLEDLKNRVNDFLKESNKKIAVIIDDIDRLDRQELFSLFKLIKLTGDFTKTYYILSFDDEMVASSIGERFAEGNSDSGHNFLEKIIQVPLRIPQALSKDLLNYTFELLNKVLDENKIDLGSNEEQNVGYIISQNLLPRIKTPRLAVRYTNSLSFLIPLLNGEVNMSDLILFEGIKIFFPKHYDFIKKSPEYFIETFDETFDRGKNNEKVKEFKSKLEQLNEDLSKIEQKSIINLLKHLFPLIKEALENYSFRNGDTSWAKEKRIVSPKYFNRYFIYSVPKDDISDIYFNDYINNISTKSYEIVLNETNEIFNNIEPIEYLNKIGFYEESVDWETRKVIIKLICSNQHKFEGLKGGSFMLSFYNPKSQAAIAISRLLSKHQDYSEKFEFAKYLMSDEIPFKFSKELIRWFKVGKAEEEQTINNSDIKLLNKLILDRALSDCLKNDSNLFEKYENNIFSLLDTYYENNPQDLREYFKKLLESNSKFIEKIIHSLTSTIYSSSNPEPYKVDFKKESFEILNKYYDIDSLHTALITNFGEEIEKDEVKFFDMDEGQTILNAMRQFVHWYNLDSNLNITEK